MRNNATNIMLSQVRPKSRFHCSLKQNVWIQRYFPAISVTCRIFFSIERFCSLQFEKQARVYVTRYYSRLSSFPFHPLYLHIFHMIRAIHVKLREYSSAVFRRRNYGRVQFFSTTSFLKLSKNRLCMYVSVCVYIK